MASMKNGWKRMQHVMLLLGLALAPGAALACPACKDALSSDPVGWALSWTTLLLISVPMLLFGSIGAWVAYAQWRVSRTVATATVPAARWSAWTEKEREA